MNEITVITQPSDYPIKFRYPNGPHRLNRAWLVRLARTMARMYVEDRDIPTLARRAYAEDAEKARRVAAARRANREPRHYRAGGPKEHWHKVFVMSR
jgi:hypothetical protein